MAEICRGLAKWKELKRVCKAMKTDLLLPGSVLKFVAHVATKGHLEAGDLSHDWWPFWYRGAMLLLDFLMGVTSDSPWSQDISWADFLPRVMCGSVAQL